MSGFALNESTGRAEAIGAIATVILAVIGLAGLIPNLLACIATILIGAGILVEGWASSLGHRQLSTRAATSGQSSVMEGAMSAEVLGGIAGVILGILALFARMPDTLLAVALLVYGATLLLSSFGMEGGSMVFSQTASPSGTATSMPMAPSGHLLVGLAAVVLGILAVVGLAPTTLILVGLLSLGAAMLLSRFRFS